MNAASYLAAAKPETFEDHMGVAFGWMALADSWSLRQGNEVEFQKWMVNADSETEDA